MHCNWFSKLSPCTFARWELIDSGGVMLRPMPEDGRAVPALTPLLFGESMRLLPSIFARCVLMEDGGVMLRPMPIALGRTDPAPAPLLSGASSRLCPSILVRWLLIDGGGVMLRASPRRGAAMGVERSGPIEEPVAR